MTTTQRVKYSQQSKCVTSEVLVESDEMSQDEILAKSKQLGDKAQEEAANMTMRMRR